MKKSLFLFIAVLTILFTACATAAVSQAPDELDIAIRDASDYLNDNIPRSSKIVILNIQSDSNALSEYIIEELIANAVNDKIFTVVDRAQLELIRAEQNFQLSGEVDDRQALEVGRFFGAQYIVSGAFSELGERYRMRIRALNVQTAQVQGQYNRNIQSGATITALMRSRSGGSSVASSGSSSVASTGSRTTTTGNTTTGSTTASTTETTTQTRQTTQPTQTQQQGAEIGIYTFYPRLRPTRAGLNVNDIFIPQITVTRDFIVIHFCRNATGVWEDEKWDSGISGFYDANYFTLQNLDNPSQFYSPVSQQSTSNGMGRIWTMSYRRFNATRLKLTGKQYGGDQQPFVFEEIDISKGTRTP